MIQVTFNGACDSWKYSSEGLCILSEEGKNTWPQDSINKAHTRNIKTLRLCINDVHCFSEILYETENVLKRNK